MSSTPDPELKYLQPGFDPNSLTMPKLRGILNQYNVDYSSAVKKGQLVDLFEAEIRPQAKRILGQRNRTKRSTRGIVDVPSAEPSVNGEQDEDTEEDQLPAKTPNRGSRRTTRVKSEEATPVPPPTVTRSGRPSTSRFARPTSEDSAATESSRKASGGRRTRHSTATPSVKIEEEEDQPEAARPNRRESYFSSENVFQSGSSPIPERDPSRGDRRRRTTGGETTDKKKRSSSRKHADEEDTPSSRKKSSTRRVKPSVVQHEEEVEAGEEFTPEETQDLAVAQRQQNGAIVRPSRPRAARPKSTITKLAYLTLSLGVLGGLFTWRQEKLAVGFCGVGREPLTRVADVEIPSLVRDTVLPSCEPCPPHAYCYADLKVSCEDDFVQVAHPLSLGGLVPLPPTCEADGVKARKVQAVADRAIEELRERSAKVECGELRDENTGKKVTTSEIPEPELKATVSAKRHKRMSQDEFEDLWHSALGDIMARDEVVGDASSRAGTTTRTLRSTSQARFSLSCALRRSLRLALVRHLRQLVGALSIFAIVAYGYGTIVSGREMESRAKQLAGFALDRLAHQAAYANYYGDEQDENGHVERYVGVAQLRDDVLRDEFSASRRKKLWERVQKKVEENANIRSAVREGRSGEVGRVWEWIGAVGALEFGDDEESSRPGTNFGRGLGSQKRKSQRFSIGSRYADSSPLARGTPPRPQDLQRWEEARPMY